MDYIRPFADLSKFCLHVSFSVEMEPHDKQKICEHYRQLGEFYNILKKVDLKPLGKTDHGFEVYRVTVHLEKGNHKHSDHLSSHALVNIFEYDLQIIRQLHNIFDLEYHIQG